VLFDDIGIITLIMSRSNKSDSSRPIPVKKTSPAEVKATQALRPPEARERLAIQSHRNLVGSSRAIAERVNADPEFSVMFLINPVLALERYGVELSAEIKRHILHTLQHPAALRTRRDELEAKLREELGEAPKTDDEAWLARLLFERLRLQPLEIGAAKPVYMPPLNAEILKQLALERPNGKKRYPGPRLIKVRSFVSTSPARDAMRRLDLYAKPPQLPTAATAPATIRLVDVWFYKEANPLVRDVLEYGLLQKRGFPFHSPDSFRQIAEGRKTNAFRIWVRALRLKEQNE
jgi:hypothetical protein